MYEIETNYVYKDIHKNKDKFNFREYPENSKFYDKTNKKVINKLKDGVKGVSTVAFEILEV